MAPMKLGDELRAALVSKSRCWGVLCLHRADGTTGFSEEDVALVRALAPHIAEGLRRALVVERCRDLACREREGPGSSSSTTT